MKTVYADAPLKNDALKHFNITEGQVSAEVQTAAFEALNQSDFPSIRDEEWKYTNVKKMVSKAYNFNPTGEVSADAIQASLIDGLEGNKLVFVNGQFNAALSSIEEIDKITVTPLSSAFDSQPELIKKYFGKSAVVEGEPFTALNTALAKDGVFIHVPKSKVLEKPVLALYISDATQGDVISQPRNLIVVDENAQATFIENFLTIGENHSLTNGVTEVAVATAANVDHYKLQNETENISQVMTTQVVQADNSFYSNTTITTGGGVIRNNLNIALGEHCETYMNGLYVTKGKTHVDNHTVVDHKMPNSESHELYKGLLDGKSTGVFNGKIFVRQDAQKTNAFQSNKNILISEGATVETKPQLEIWADDVSCSHGCTVGALDEDPLFYLRARGISEDKARALLMFAFAGDILERIKPEAVKAYVEKTIAERLNYELI